MKIGFAARWTPLDKLSWSGTCFYSFKQIEKLAPVEIFVYKWPWLLREQLTARKSWNRRIFNKHTSVEFLTAYAKWFSRQLEKDLIKRKVDLLYVPGSPQLISFLKTDIPVIFMTDASFQQIQSYYPYFSNLHPENIRQGIELDKKAFLNASHCMLASEWCRQSAMNDYGVPEKNISVVPMGANLDLIPEAGTLNSGISEICRLLFIGVEWDRKGGDIVLETFHQLKKKGMQVQLHIIGCVPPHELSHEKNITVIPFLDKNKPEELAKLQEIYFQSDLLFVPTRAECAGVMFSEASAFGLPSVTTDTGGISTYVENGTNGYRLSMEAAPAEYADTIFSLFNDKTKLTLLKKTSRNRYEEKLNWNSWGEEFKKIAERLTGKSF